MISVVVYGRNDSHGYNLSKRATLSLNSLAQALTHPDDEILFVDWNTQVGLPAFPITIQDVLTDHCRDRLRIIRVSPKDHQNFARGRTDRPTIEPAARNVAIRRAEPRNAWILSTNTDVLLRIEGGSLSNIAEALDGHYYASPRYELPEWLWESLPRADPRWAEAEISRAVNDFLPLNVVRSSPQNLFDAPGDFQLVRRTSLESIGCFDETMLLGWHVDSNLANRMRIAFGKPHSLEGLVDVFHCNHTRQTTHFHASNLQSNDLQTYVIGVSDALAQSGQTDWGLPHLDLRVEHFNHLTSSISEYVSTLADIQGDAFRTSLFDPSETLCGVPPRVSFPFLLDVIWNAPTAPVLYLGSRPEMRDLLMGACNRLGIRLVHDDFDGLRDQLLCAAPIVVCDLTPPNAMRSRKARTLAELGQDDKSSLRGTLSSLRSLLEYFDWHKQSPRFVFINAESNELEMTLIKLFDMMPSQYYSRIRLASLNPVLLNELTRRSQMPSITVRMQAVLHRKSGAAMNASGFFFAKHPRLRGLARNADRVTNNSLGKLIRRIRMRLEANLTKESPFMFMRVALIPISLLDASPVDHGVKPPR